jgi:GNAT superfamily N-acetyltransferase
MASTLYQVVPASAPDGWARFCALPGLPALDPAQLGWQRPDDAWALLAGGAPAARCSLWWAESPRHVGLRVGVIGHFAARHADAAVRLLRHAADRLREHGCELAVGPMDGNTWQGYRLVTDRGGEPPFFLEPDNPDDWPGHFEAAGFSVLARYYSALNDRLDRGDPAADEVAHRLAARGVALRALRLDDLAGELGRIHALSLECFKGGLLFTPVRLGDFLAQYEQLRPYVVPELVLLAEEAGRLAGYVFAVPDRLQARRGAAIDTAIIKTLAVHPEHQGTGLGRLLAARCHEAMRSMGYRRAIHALMVDTSAARRLSDPIARPIRRYALYARRLGEDG